MADPRLPLAILTHPYSRLHPVEPSSTAIRAETPRVGSALVWCMGGGRADRGVAQVLRERPGGVALLVILPAEVDLLAPSLTSEIHSLRPHGILPYHPSPAASDLAQVLRRPPSDIAGEVIDYLRWRGLAIDRDTAFLLRRVLELSSELRSISAVARSLYLSRRALGRRLLTRGLPVPSHWLQVGRLLRVSVRLQNCEATVSSAAFEHGYPDGFSLSNQMERLLGYRPSQVRAHLGWEWLIESWLRREAEAGRLNPAAVSAADDETPSPVGKRSPVSYKRSPDRSERHSSAA